MDYNEVVKGFTNRHPWEISRTGCIHKSWEPYYSLHTAKSDCSYINIGAGDCYFDRRLTAGKNCRLTAVDIAYPDDVKTEDNITMVNSMERADGEYDFAIMMDSLEYMDDDVEYIRQLAAKVKPQGHIFLTLPAWRGLFGAHDVLVGNKRRYDYRDIEHLAESVDGLSIAEIKPFYWTLYVVRVFQKLFKLKADEKVTTGWSHSGESFVTKLFVWLLNVDYCMCKIIPFRGLSWQVVLKKDK